MCAVDHRCISLEECFDCLTNGGKTSLNVLVEETLSTYLKTLDAEEIGNLSRKYLKVSRCSTLLQLAMSSGFVKIAEVLIKKGIGVDVGRYDNLGIYRLPLTEAINGRLLGLVPLFMIRNCKVETFCISREETPLCSALKLGFLELAEQLLGRGADINCLDHAIKGSLLHYTAAHNKVEESKWLLDRGITYGPNSVGQTPLHLACGNGSAEVARYLIKNGHNITSTDIAGYSPLAYACFKGQSKVLGTILSCFYPSENSFKDDLLKFFMHPHKDCLKFFLLGLHVKITCFENFLDELMQAAMESGCCKVTEYLFLCGARTNIRSILSVHQNTSLGVAISSANPLQIDRVKRWAADARGSHMEEVQKCIDLSFSMSSKQLRLMDISRMVIFQKVLTSCSENTYWEAISKLPLPLKLKKFINFDDMRFDCWHFWSIATILKGDFIAGISFYLDIVIE